MNNWLKILRGVTVLFWITVLSVFVLPWPEPLDRIVPIIGLCVLLSHALEAIVFRKRLLQLGGYTKEDVVNMLIFGIFHVAGRYLKAAQNPPAHNPVN